METIVEGEDIDPAELARPGWAEVRRKQQALKAAEQAALQASGKHHTNNPPRKSARRTAKRKPPAEPLPEDDIKIILRPHGGLALTAISLATLADTVQKQAGLDPYSADQVRIQATSNFIVVSTPSEARARQYEKITSLVLKGHQYEISTHVSAPANTVTGVIFNIPEDDTPEQILNSVCQYNPGLRILDAKRLNSSNIAQILFDGTKVPYWIRYRAATYRCKPFRRKSEACTACWQPGHRRDVCPNAQAPPRCPTCGLVTAPEDHPCVPKCIVCGGPHLTGTVECPKRYQPRRHPKSYAQAATQNTTPTKEDFPPLPGNEQQESSNSPPNKNIPSKSMPQRGKPRKEDPVGNQVSCPSAPSSSSPQSPNHPSLTSTPHLDVFKELQAIRAEITMLRQENAALKRENNALRQQMNSRPVEPSQNSPDTENDNGTPLEPPPKRKAVSADATPTTISPISEERLASIENACRNALAEQKEEYINLHQILLTNQSTMQANIEALRAEMHNFIQGLVASNTAPILAQNIPIPPFNPANGQAS